MDKDKLYELIDNEDDMTDREKRAEYFAAIEEQEAEERWEQDQ